MLPTLCFKMQFEESQTAHLTQPAIHDSSSQKALCRY